jgi:hypothetical protein
MAKQKRAVVKEPDVPECERLRLINEQGHNRMIGDFLTFVQGLIRVLSSSTLPHTWWLDVEDINIEYLLEHFHTEGEYNWDDEVLTQFWQWLVETKEKTKVWDIRVEDIMYEYFDLDRDKIENERREMLAGCRATNALNDARKDLGLEDK